MKSIILAGKGIPTLPSGNDFETSLGWILNSLNEAGIKDNTIVAGKKVEVISNNYSNVKIIDNKDWQTTGPLASLLLCDKLAFDSDILISFADIVYTAETVNNFLNDAVKSDIKIVIDQNWINRYTRSEKSIDKAEKIWIDHEGYVKKATREYSGQDTCSGEYVGLCFIKKKLVSEIIEISKYLLNSSKEEIKGLYPIGFMDLFNELLIRNYKINSYKIAGNWAELDNLADFNSFVFQTKSHTLANLKGQLKNGKILTQIPFNIAEWQSKKQIILSNIQDYFRNDNLIVRSSSTVEDSFESSMAGYFTSVIGVNRKDKLSIENAIEEVIESYGDSKNPEDIVFVQPMLPNVIMSGVLFTHDLKTGSPYLCVNWTKSNNTDVVTSGSEGEYNLYFHMKDYNFDVKDNYLKKLFRCVSEIEKLVQNNKLDIEFAFDSKGDLYIFQIRPLILNKSFNRKNKPNFRLEIDNKIEDLKNIFSPKKNVSGKTTILGKMPDWNPAELIGSRPSKLSLSLFHKLITKNVWRLARSKMGYFNPKSQELLIEIFGQPYIDVRNSLNSFTPKNLRPELRQKLIDESLFFLKNNRHLHDKLEFDVATTCHTPFFKHRRERWVNFGFTDEEIFEMEVVYRNHTLKILDGSLINFEKSFGEIESLEKIRIEIMNSKDKDLITKAKELITECERLGTINFSILARSAFIGNTFFKAFLKDSIISQETYNLFLNSINTVATEMLEDLNDIRTGNRKIADFLKKYGHLRPGTFDINSFRYDENPDIYFDLNAKSEIIPKTVDSAGFSFTNNEKLRMSDALEPLDIKVDSFIKFTEESIKGREYSKFLFTRCVSDVLSLISNWGKFKGFSRKDLSFADFNFLTNINFDDEESLDVLKDHIYKNKLKEDSNQNILLPDLITESSDIFSFYVPTDKPNFVTNNSISGELVKISDKNLAVDISQKIVMIESSDPGFDWIFTHNIKGLITKYGGAASHMTIRCSEFNLPAAIGCGNLYESFSVGDKIFLDCKNQVMKKI